MAAAARLGDSIRGTHAGEHTGHITPHAPGPVTGNISGNCSGNVFINGIAAARLGDALAPHSGTGNISSGSGNVFIGG